MLSAFVLIKLMKIKQSLALSARCNSHFFHLQPCWASHTHTISKGQQTSLRLSGVQILSLGVYSTPAHETHQTCPILFP